MKARLAAAACVLVLVACGGGSDSDTGVPPTLATTVEPTSVVDPAPTSAAADPGGTIPRSDAVPSTEELLDSGLSESQARCFRQTIDPDNTGRVASAELFGQAFAECLGAQG